MKKIALFIFFGVFLLGGCDYLPLYTSIKDIVTTPANYEGKEVRIRGTVKNVTKIPIVDFKMFILEDDSGQINVITSEALPAVGDKAVVKGIVETTALIGGQSIGLRVKESKRLMNLGVEIKL